MDTQEPIQSTGCCEPFNPELWQNKEIIWKDKLFVKDHITSFLHMPINMGARVIKNLDLIEKAGAKASHQLMLTDEKSLWGADIYVDVSKDVPGAQMATLSLPVTLLSFLLFHHNYQSFCGNNHTKLNHC